MVAEVKDYFSSLFSDSVGDMDTVDMNCLPRRVTEDMNGDLLRPFDLEEFRVAVFSMSPDKAPGPDGLNPAFFQKIWSTIGDDVFSACNSWLQTGTFPDYLFATTVVLIPKTETPLTMKDLRPISLCNVLYKILAKVLANRLKEILPAIISAE
ncbi:hypothetical protein M5689_004555 [Euphorbia peplus]|nr:hypothetical protein M5689_004555 [Euphorbia peplus]